LEESDKVCIYGAAYKVIDVLITLPVMFAGIVLPLLTSRWANNDTKGFKQLMQKSFNVMVIFTVPMIVGTQLLASDIMTLVAGHEFALSGPILQILIFAAGIIFLGNIFAHAVIAINKQKQIIGAYMLTAVSALILYFIFIPRFSYFGAAWVTIYSETVIALASFYMVWKYTKFIPNILIIFKSCAASICMLISMYSLQYFGIFNLVYIIFTAVVTYFIFIFIFKGLSKNELLSLFNK